MRELTRREMLKLSLLGAVSAAIPAGRLVASTLAESSSSPQVPLFTRPLPLPATLAPVPLSARPDPFKNTALDFYEVKAHRAEVNILGDRTTEIWGYNGTFPGPTIRTQKDRKAIVRFHNIDVPEKLTVHLHGAYADGDSDGHVEDLINKGEFKDYHYPNGQEARPMWYHDHALHHTATNVYAGLAGLYLLTDDDEQALGLPSGEFEVPLVIADRLFLEDGSLDYDFNNNGVLGDTILVNGAPWPFLEVQRRPYRLRFLNGSNARQYLLQLSTGQDFIQIGTEGGLLAAPVQRRTLFMAEAERIDCIVDFSAFPAGTNIVLRNLLGEDSRTSRVMQFKVVPSTPATLTLPSKLREVELLSAADATVTRKFELHRTGGQWAINGQVFESGVMNVSPRVGDTEIWVFRNGGGGWTHPMHIHLLNFQILDRNGRRPPPYEIGWKETVHVGKNETVRVIMRWPELPPAPLAEEIIDGRERLFRDIFVLHCHNIEHEDDDMMLQLQVLPKA